MTEYLKSNPITLRHCLLYEFLQRTSVLDVEYVLDPFCVTVGYNLNEKQDFMFWYNEFEERRFDTTRPIVDMEDDLRNDKYALRSCILYESLKYKLAKDEETVRFLWTNNDSFFFKIQRDPSFTLYNHFYKVVRENSMDFSEFDFWFSRFLNGDYDLKFERDKDKKIYELTDMPNKAMKNIVEYLDIFDRLSLQKTSRSLRLFTIDQKLFHHSITLISNTLNSSLNVNKHYHIDYTGERQNCVKKSLKGGKTSIEGVPHWKQALLDCGQILKYPNLHLDTLQIMLIMGKFSFLIENEFVKMTTSLNQLHVKNLSVQAPKAELLSSILRSLKPEYLTMIDFDIHELRNDGVSMKTVIETEHWKKAAYFHMIFTKFAGSIRHLSHFKQFSVRLEQFTVEDVCEMKEILFKSPLFKNCTLTCDFIDVNAIGQEFGDAISENSNIYHYPISDSNEYFEITATERYMDVIMPVGTKASAGRRSDF